jgi:radical SAM superfamily enzyme YgiQ (UPF0313 family)
MSVTQSPMRILLIQPAPFEDARLGLENTFWLSEPVGLTSIGTMVKDAHEVRILDMRLEKPATLPEVLNSFQPHIVGTTAMTTDAYQAKAVMMLARQLLPNCLTVMGGHHATFMPEFYDEEYVDVVCQGEGELTFEDMVQIWATALQDGAEGTKPDTSVLASLQGARVHLPDGSWTDGSKPKWREIDDFPAPDRRLIQRYKGRYFFLAAKPLASIFTSRGCSFDCNFCAIWEFYDRKTRFLSAKNIADQMEACEEHFLFLLDDNFLTNHARIERLCEELERRKLGKYWMTQGRTDFIAKYPELIERLSNVGLTGVLSGYETNDEDALEGLNKRNTVENNRKAAEILRKNGILSTGIFMVRPEFDVEDFDALYDYIADLNITFPLVTILTPLPGTELFRKRRHELLTEDFRLYDLLHPVTPTKLPRAEFYKHFTRYRSVYRRSRNGWLTPRVAWKRRDFLLKLMPGMPRTIIQGLKYQKIQFDPASYLRDEAGIIEDPRDSHGL